MLSRGRPDAQTSFVFADDISPYAAIWLCFYAATPGYNNIRMGTDGVVIDRSDCLLLTLGMHGCVEDWRNMTINFFRKIATGQKEREHLMH